MKTTPADAIRAREAARRTAQEPAKAPKPKTVEPKPDAPEPAAPA